MTNVSFCLGHLWDFAQKVKEKLLLLTHTIFHWFEMIILIMSVFLPLKNVIDTVWSKLKCRSPKKRCKNAHCNATIFYGELIGTIYQNFVWGAESVRFCYNTRHMLYSEFDTAAIFLSFELNLQERNHVIQRVRIAAAVFWRSHCCYKRKSVGTFCDNVNEFILWHCSLEHGFAEKGLDLWIFG